MPRSKIVNESFEGRNRMNYKNGHEYNINSLSLCPDGEHFLSADDLRINLWNIEYNSIVYSLIDTKPKNIEELDEVITHCEFHPLLSDTIVYTTSKGFIHICDLRIKSSFQSGSVLQFEVGKGQKKNAFSELIGSLSSGKFLPKYPYILATRDYLNIRLWDVRNSNQPPI